MDDTMHDDSTTTDTTAEQGEPRSIPPDAFAAALSLVALAADPRGFKKKLRALHDALAAVSAAQLALSAARAAHDAQLAADCAELERERASVQKRRVDVAIAEGQLAERGARYRELEKQWGNLKLPGDTFAAFGGLTRAPLYSALEVARFTTEHGRLPAVDETVTVREDTEGNEFPASTTITRQADPGAPSAGPRGRPGRRNSAPVGA